MPKYYVPVMWTMFKTMEIEAENIEGAIAIADSTGSPDNGEYSKGSFEVEKEAIEEIV